MRVKEKSEKSSLKFNIEKTKMASSPITTWQIDGEKVETVTDFIFLVSKITADMKLKDTYSLEENPTNLDSVLRSRDITLFTKIRIVKGMIFPMYGCESWMLSHP